MKEKGLVMEINDHNVILLTKDGQFISRRISGLCPQIGDEINIEEEKRKRLWFSVGVLVAAAVLIVAIFAGKLWSESQVPFLANGVVSYVTVDINPSVELGLDQDKKVVTVLPLNQDGRLLLQGLVLKGQTSEEAIEAFIDAAAKEGYLAPEKENQVIINISEKVPDKSQVQPTIEIISEKAKKTIAEHKIQVKIDVISTDFDLREKAKELDISSGKYALLIEAKEAGLNIDVEKIKKSGLTKAIKDAGGDPGEIIKSAQEETNFPDIIKKWQQQLKDTTQLNKEEEKNNKNVLKAIQKLWKENEKDEKDEKAKEKTSEINEQKNNLKEQEKDKKDKQNSRDNSRDNSKDNSKDNSRNNSKDDGNGNNNSNSSNNKDHKDNKDNKDNNGNNKDKNNNKNDNDNDKKDQVRNNNYEGRLRQGNHVFNISKLINLGTR